MSPIDRAAAAPRPFNFARLALALVVPIIAYASLRPFAGWLDRGIDLSILLFGPDGRIARFDAILNVVGYVPFGLSLALSLYPRVRGKAAFWIAALVPSLFSVAVEILQAYLPGRAPSRVDVVMNVAGAHLGAALAVACTPWLADHRGGAHLRQRWLAPGHLTEGGLLVLAAWFVGLFAQRTVLFGVGDWRGNLQAAVDPAVPAFAHFATEAGLVATNFVVAALVLRLVLAEGAPRVRWLLALAAGALVLRVVAQLAFWLPQAVWQWITPANVSGWVIGLAVAPWAMRASRRAAALMALGLLAAVVVVVNLAPPDPKLWLQKGPPREEALIGLLLVARYVSKAWPLAAAIFLVLAWRRDGRPGGASAPAERPRPSAARR